MKKEIWFLIGLGIIFIVLLCIVILVPAKPIINSKLQGNEDIQITYPIANTAITSPIKITGMSKTGWGGFEGQVGTVDILDYKGNNLGAAVLKALTDWTQPPVNFEADLSFTPNNSGPATLVFHKENPSGLPQYDKTFSLPVKISSSGEIMTVKAFFAKNEITGSTCSVVFPVNRVVPKTQSVARAALEELFKGPTDAEKSQGYYSSINPGVKVQSLTIDSNGTARADFSSELESPGGSCRVTEIRSEINFTLKQFSTIKNVIISINGVSDTILQP